MLSARCTAYCIIFAWGCSDLIWLCITVHLFEPWKNSFKKPTLTIFSSKATNECMCPMWHFSVVAKRQEGNKMCSPKGSSKNTAETTKHWMWNSFWTYKVQSHYIGECWKLCHFSLSSFFILHERINETEVKLILQIIFYYVNWC